jgi:two-component SAPR family response regulator
LVQAPLMISQGRGHTVADWIGHLPESVCEQNPFLDYWLGISLMPYDPRESLSHLEKAFNLFKEKKDPAGIFLSFSGVVIAIVHGADTFKQFDRWISILYKLRTEYKDFPSEEIEARVTMSMLWAFCLRQPQHPDYEAWSERALSLIRTIKDNTTKLQTLLALALYRLRSGELSKAAILINFFREAAQSPDITPVALITLKVLQSFYCWLASDFEECYKAATDGLDLASSKGIHFMDCFIAGHGAAGALSVGDLETVERFHGKMTSCLDRPMAWAKTLYYLLGTWKALLQKDLEQALLHAEVGARVSLEAGSPQTSAIDHLGLALVMHELKREKEASAHIREVHKISRLTNVYQHQFRCLLAEAQFALEREDKDSARGFLKKAMALGKEQGYTNTFFWVPSVMAGLCVEALEAGIEVDYVRNLVRKRCLIPDTPPLDCENWPWPMKIYTFGRFTLVENDKPLRGKAQKKPLDMLKAVIALGGREVSEQKLTDALWPDARGDTGRMLFKTTLYRLRQLVENSKALVVCEGRLTVDNKQCWVDAWAFERVLGDAERMWERSRERGRVRAVDRSQEAVGMTEKAVALYRGHFLEADRNEPWTISLREHLRMRYVRAVSRLGYHWEEEKKFERAVDCYQSALRVDDLTEEFYQHLMLCYQKLGRKAEAVKTYRRCCSVLKANFGMEPSPETTAIYNAIMQ